MKRTFLLLGIILTALFSLNAQIVDPVKWDNSSRQLDDGNIELVFKAQIDMPWHLYAMNFEDGGPVRTSFYFNESENYELVGEPTEEPEPVTEFDETFGITVKYFSGQATFRQIIKPLTDKSFKVTGDIEYQVCEDEKCVYFNPEFSINVKGNGKATSETREEAADDAALSQGIPELTPQITEEALEDEAAADAPEDKSLIGFFLVSMLLGLAGILTPCVFPMIPMTVSFFMQGQQNRFASIVKALIFGISVVLLYTAVGLIVSLTSAGADLTTTLSTHWIPNMIFFVLFLVFAASFFGMFEIVLPSGLSNKADRQVDKGGYLASFFMALTLVLVSFSCTGPIVGALLVKAAGGDILEPVIGMFGFGLAFALPFTLFAIFPSMLKSLPKSGGWMNSVKVVLGFIILAFSMKFISNIDQTYHLGILSRDLYISIWIVLFILLGMYLLGKIKFAHDSDLKHVSVFRLVLAIASFSFAVYMVPGLFGANLSGVSGLMPPKTAQKFDVTAYSGGPAPGGGQELCDEALYADFLHLPHGLNGYYEYEQGMACARELDKPVLLDFKGHACSNCKEMENKVWSDPKVLQRLREDYIIIALYVDDRTKLPEDKWVTSEYDGKVKKTIGKVNADLQISKYNINSQPFYVLVDPHTGESLTEPIGFDLKVENFVEFLDAGKKAFEKK